MAQTQGPPTVRRGPNAKAHPYPYEIAIRAQTFTVGATFYYAFADAAIGDYFKAVPDYYDRVRSLFLSRGLSADGWEVNWKAFEAYVNTFPNPIIQNALLTAIAHWDAYVSRLAAFVRFARRHVGSPGLAKKEMKALGRVAFLPVPEQLDALSTASGAVFPLEIPSVNSLYEMSLVRNLGVHCEWIVDSTYLAHSRSKQWSPGDLRTVAIAELEEWRVALTDVISATSRSIAAKYATAPDFIPSP